MQYKIYLENVDARRLICSRHATQLITSKASIDSRPMCAESSEKSAVYELDGQMVGYVRRKTTG